MASNKSRCPYCNSVITRVNVEEVELERDTAGPWKGVSYGCPVCKKILSIGVNPDVQRGLIASLVQGGGVSGKSK